MRDYSKKKKQKTVSKVSRRSLKPQPKKTQHMKREIRDIKEMKKIWENAMEIDDETLGYELFEIIYNHSEGKAYIDCDTDDRGKYSESCKRLIKAAKTKDLFDYAKTKDFYPEIRDSYKKCFGIDQYQPNTLNNSVDYALLNLDSHNLDLVSFCTVQYNLNINEEYNVSVKQNNGIFTNSPIHYVWNVCKNSNVYGNVKGICNVMMNKVVQLLKEHNNQSIIKNIPIFLNVRNDNEPAIKCYQRSGFSQLMYTPSTTLGLMGHIHNLIKMKNTPISDIMMYYCEANMRFVDKTGKIANIIPSITEKFSLICHGSLNPGIYKVIDNEGTVMMKPLEEEYNFPIKKIGIFGFPGTTLIAPAKNMGDEKIIPSLICTNALIPHEEHTLNNISMTYILKSSNFGVNELDDIKNGRNTFVGLWHCNRNTQVFDWDVLKKYNWEMDLNTVFQYISEYTKKMNIPLSSVELNIFACRGYGLPDTPTTCVYLPENAFQGGSKTISKVNASPVMVIDEPKDVIKNIYTESPENLIRKLREARDNYCKSSLSKNKTRSRTQKQDKTKTKTKTKTSTRKSRTKTM